MSAEAHPFQRELSTVLTVASEASAILRARRGAQRVREKGRADLVTDVDEASERAIERGIRAAFPDDVIVSEEFSASAAGSGRRWIADPLDGTVNFVHRHPFACVSIALVDDEGPAVGAIEAPFLGEVYHAVRGGGAFLNGDRIAVSEVTDPADALVATGFPFKPGKGDPTTYFELVSEILLSTHGVRRAGSAALDLAYLAAGRVDAFFELGLGAWDMAAGLLLVTEAGGTVTGWPGDADPPLDTGRLLASNGAIHEWLQATTARYLPRIDVEKGR